MIEIERRSLLIHSSLSSIEVAAIALIIRVNKSSRGVVRVYEVLASPPIPNKPNSLASSDENLS